MFFSYFPHVSHVIREGLYKWRGLTMGSEYVQQKWRCINISKGDHSDIEFFVYILIRGCSERKERKFFPISVAPPWDRDHHQWHQVLVKIVSLVKMAKIFICFRLLPHIIRHIFFLYGLFLDLPPYYLKRMFIANCNIHVTIFIVLV